MLTSQKLRGLSFITVAFANLAKQLEENDLKAAWQFYSRFQKDGAGYSKIVVSIEGEFRLIEVTPIGQLKDSNYAFGTTDRFLEHLEEIYVPFDLATNAVAKKIELDGKQQ